MLSICLIVASYRLVKIMAADNFFKPIPITFLPRKPLIALLSDAYSSVLTVYFVVASKVFFRIVGMFV